MKNKQLLLLFILLPILSFKSIAEGISTNNNQTEIENTYIKKTFFGVKEYKKYFPEKTIEKITQWKSEKIINCNYKKVTCKTLRTRLIYYTDGTIVQENIASTANPPEDWDYEGTKEKYITKLYAGINSHKKHFPNKKIKEVTKWVDAKHLGCSEIKKRKYPSRHSSQIIVVGRKCRKLRERYIYYVDGVVVKEKRIAEIVNRW